MQLSQFGKYKIVDKLGQGAMGEVFRAHDPILKRDVAIKIVAGKLSADKVARERFLREAQSASQLTHPNIVTVYDYGDEQGTAFMVMELLGGQDLREVIEKRLVKGFDEKLAIIEQILDGLAFAHSRGVVHRDIKPGNVHVLPNGQAKLMDFGLARQAQDGATTGVIMGTPFYISPEQAQGESATARSDVFAAGAMFYELLSGKRPFGGQTIPAVLYAVTQVEPEPLARLVVGIPEGVAALVARALSKAPQARYADGGEMLKALLQARRGEEGVEDAHPVQELGPPLSSLDETPPDMRDALADIALYLADRVPPLMVAGAVATFVEAPEEGAAAEIWAWAGRTLAGEPDLTMVDLVFHALYKLNMIGELRLLEDKKLLAYLKSVGEAIARACPPPERTRLRRALLMLGRPELLGGQGVRRLGDVDAPPLVPNTPGLRRLSFIEQRLRREAGVGPGAELTRRRIVSQALSIAATEAKDEKDLQGHLRRLENLGVKAGAGMVFRSLGGALGDWAMPKGLAVDTLDLNTSPEIHAMRRIVALAEDPVEIARRFRHLVEAAIEQFNGGGLGRAVQVFDLAAQLASEKKVEPGLLQPILTSGHESLDLNRVRTYMDRPDRHSQLQSVMRFFAAGLGPAPLLDQLEGEEKRERRRLLLDLLAVHAEPARALALERLEGSTRRPASDFVRRNWIYLLRQVPRTPGEPIEREIEAVARFATPQNPAFLVKEALQHLGQTPHPRASQALVTLLRTWEKELERSDLDAEARDQGQASLDRLAMSLARQRSTSAWRALLDHALSRRPEWGSTIARLAELGTQDLSASPDFLEGLMDEIEACLPRGVIRRFVARKAPELPALVGALAGTRTPEARALLQEVAERHASQEAGRAAARALAPSAATPASGGQSGKLDGYGLPALLDRLAQSAATGTLNLQPQEGGGPPASLSFVRGRVHAARRAHRQGTDAVYQLFERPISGTYAFEAGHPVAGAPLAELQALIKEGVRRAQELTSLSAIVPEDLPLEATGSSPGTVAEEKDYDLIVALWQKACAGIPSEPIEAELAADAFRILRPLAQWLEEGALRIVETAAPAPAPASGA